MNPESKKNTDDLIKPKNSLGNSFSTAAFYLSILFFIIGFNFSDVMVGNWYQQFMPDLGTQQINDIIFIDSLNGFAVTSRNINPDTSSILKTTNGGDNWQVILVQNPRRLSRVKFINAQTGFISGGSGSGTPFLYKSTDGGNNWFTIPGATLGTSYWDDMSVLNEDTIWLVDDNGFNGGVFFTSNGGSNWVNQLYLGSNNPDKIYFYNRNLGFCGTGIVLYRTTNSGVNWNIVPGEHSFTDMCFVDSLTGWKVRGNDPDTIKNTTNGGVNWFKQYLPIGNWINTMFKIAVLNKDTIWGVGGVIQWIPSTSNFRGLIYKTTNGGLNWGYQIPDTGANYYQFTHIQFVNKLNGWAYLPSRNIYSGFHGFHTNTGGDTTIYIGLQQISTEVPKEYELFQNYPNPFNPRTVIPFSLKQSAHVKITIYNITGREVQKLANRNLSAGRYEVDFMGKYTASGVYFYRIEVAGKNNKQLYTETKKMILLK